VPDFEKFTKKHPAQKQKGLNLSGIKLLLPVTITAEKISGENGLNDQKNTLNFSFPKKFTFFKVDMIYII
jgi:hypothetical protein